MKTMEVGQIRHEVLHLSSHGAGSRLCLAEDALELAGDLAGQILYGGGRRAVEHVENFDQLLTESL